MEYSIIEYHRSNNANDNEYPKEPTMNIFPGCYDKILTNIDIRRYLSSFKGQMDDGLLIDTLL